MTKRGESMKENENEEPVILKRHILGLVHLNEAIQNFNELYINELNRSKVVLSLSKNKEN